MRRARRDSDNFPYFSEFEPAVFSDFYPQITVVVILALAGVGLLITGTTGVAAALSLLMTICILGWQFYAAAKFWSQSVGAESAE